MSEIEYYEGEADVRAVEVDEEVLAEPASGAVTYAATERLIIRNASLSLVVPDTQTALDGINELVDELGGYVVESNVYQYQEGLRAHVTLRIPAESLDLALERIRDLATEVRSESISGQDVTEEYVDLQSRLRHLEATEARLLEFLEERPRTRRRLWPSTSNSRRYRGRSSMSRDASSIWSSRQQWRRSAWT